MGKLHLRRYALVAAAVWTAVVLLLLAYNIRSERHHTRELALLEARAIFNKDLAFRLWATRHGGVYVPTDERTRPNPYLAHIPERDLVTPSGRRLTLMNPAYMLRQLMAEHEGHYGAKGHITSLQPLNPDNAPDDWERSALLAFERGVEEVAEVTPWQGRPALRLMRPLVTREGCLKCHAQQGYEVGDIRGGVGVRVPIDGYLAGERAKIVALSWSSAILWLLGLAGLAVGFVMVGRGARARQVVEDEVRRTRDRLEATLDALPDFLFEVGEDGRVVSCRTPQVTGFSLATGMVGGDLEEWLPASAAAAVTRAMAQAEVSGRSRGETFALDHPDGRRWFELSVSMRESDGGRLATVLARDITGRRDMEEALRQAQKMEAVGLLAGGVAHDFNNLLQVILGYGELLPEGGPLAATATRQIMAAASRARDLVGQLLTFSRKQVLELTVLDLNQVVGELLKMIRRVIGEHIELELRAGSELWPVRCDRGQIEQTIMNLCLNARDAMPDGGRLVLRTANVTRSVEEPPGEGDGRFVQVAVEDSGCGIAAEHREHIFEPFFTTKAVGQGSGLGLAVVYGIVKNHGGLVEVASEPGQGTTIHILLPAVEGEAVEEPSAVAADGARGGRETILLAEDDGTVRDLMRSSLSRAGYTVITACDGMEAVEVFTDRAAEVDLVILDVVMPRLGGRAALERMRALKPGLRVLFASGYDPDDHFGEEPLEPLMVRLQKPFRRDLLLTTVRSLLDRSP